MRAIEKLKQTVEKNPLVWLAITFFGFLSLGWGLRETIIKVSGLKVVAENEYITPVASFEYERLEDGLVKFIDKSQNAKSLQWSFGDGTFGGIQDTLHKFERNGSYNVELVATNEVGKHSNKITIKIENVALAKRVFYADKSSRSRLPIFISINGIARGALTKTYDRNNLPECWDEGTITVMLPSGEYTMTAAADSGLYTWETKVEFEKGICAPFGLSSN